MKKIKRENSIPLYFPEMRTSDSDLPAKGQTPFSAACDESLTNTQDVETEPLRSRLVDQLVGKTVKSNMARKGQVSKLFILEFQRGNAWESMNFAPGYHTWWTLLSPFLSSWDAWKKELPSLPTPSLASTQQKVLITPKPCSFHKIDYVTPKVDCLPRCLMPCYMYIGPRNIELLEVTISNMY